MRKNSFTLFPWRLCLAVTISWLDSASTAAAAAHITSPQQFFGFNIGDDYCLANYRQLTNYWTKLARESDRLKVVNIGMTEEGRPQLMSIVTSPANHRKLSHYQDVARRLALADSVSDAEARRLSRDGKVVVWIDGGLHANEVLGAQQLIETLYQFVSAKDGETLRILDDIIILFVHCNPDGMDLCADWYMRESDPKKRSLGDLPVCFRKSAVMSSNCSMVRLYSKLTSYAPDRIIRCTSAQHRTNEREETGGASGLSGGHPILAQLVVVSAPRASTE